MRSRSYWHTVLERHLEGITGDIEALIWATGCVWSLRVERLIARAPPIVNCTLFIAGLHLWVNFLLAHLTWYGFPRSPLEFQTDAQRPFIKVALFLAIVAAVGLASPGSPRRRIFAACAFPLLGFVAMSAVAGGMRLVTVIHMPEYQLAELTLRGLALGLISATLISLPTALLYRGSAVPVAILSILPALAKADAGTAHSHSGNYADVLIWHLGPFLCSFTVIALATYVCNRSQSRPLDD